MFSSTGQPALLSTTRNSFRRPFRCMGRRTHCARSKSESMSHVLAARRIRKLSLTVSDPAESRHFAGVVEEGLRLASLPGEAEGRHYHFRRLKLGKIRRHESSSRI